MKKYVFLALLFTSLVGFFIKASLGLSALAALVAWVAYENSQRSRFRFLRGSGFKEKLFDLSSEAAQVEISLCGAAVAFATTDQALRLCGFGGEIWKRPLEPGTLALLPLDDGACILALADELVLLDSRGMGRQRLSFPSAPYRQSYRLALSADGQTVMLHTPWFLQFASADLSELRGRIDCEATGHYMKHAALAPDGRRAYFAGAKLLEEGEGTQARWGCWQLEEDAWVPAWSQAEEAYGNSHVRGLSLSLDGSTLALELHREGYEFKVMDRDGRQRWRRAGERPCLAPKGDFVLWENPFEGLTLTELDGLKKIWSYKNEEQVRFKALGPAAEAWVLEGRKIFRMEGAGAKAWPAAFQNDPNRISAAGLGGVLALVGARKGALLRLPQ